METLDKLREKPHLSVSSINDYMDCGLLYKFSRVDKVPSEGISDMLVYGKTVHQVLADFNQERMIDNFMTPEDLKDLFEEYWQNSAAGNESIRYSIGKSYSVILNEGKKLLQTFAESVPNHQIAIYAIEEPFEFYIDGMDIPIIGVIDLVEEDSNGNIIISDYKTTAKAYASSQVDNNLQLTVYNMAAKNNGYADRDILLRFDCLIKTKTPKFEQYYTTRTDEDMIRTEKKIRHVWEGIQKGVFIPNDTSWKCKGCSYKDQCNEWFLE